MHVVLVRLTLGEPRTLGEREEHFGFGMVGGRMTNLFTG